MTIRNSSEPSVRGLRTECLLPAKAGLPGASASGSSNKRRAARKPVRILRYKPLRADLMQLDELIERALSHITAERPATNLALQLADHVDFAIEALREISEAKDRLTARAIARRALTDLGV